MEEGIEGKELSKGVEQRNGKLEWKHSFRKEWKREWKKKVEKGFTKKLGLEDRKERTKVSLVVSSSTTAWPPALYFRGSRLCPFPRTSQECRVAIKFKNGTPDKTLRAVEIMYESTQAKAPTPDGGTGPMDVRAGVLQGDTWAPHLLIIVA